MMKFIYLKINGIKLVNLAIATVLMSFSKLYIPNIFLFKTVNISVSPKFKDEVI